MARKTNYAFDRNNRARAKAAKREAKRQAKLSARAEKRGGADFRQPNDDISEQVESPERGAENLDDDDATPTD